VLIVPALTLCYLLASGLPWSRRLAHAGAALLVTLAVSAPWVLAVELTPATQRPYVGGSADNSVVSLMFGYNGFARLWQEDWTVWLGPTGPLRLFNKQIGGQASWLLPFALLGLIATIWRLRHSPTAGAEGRVRRAALILWTTWLILPAVYFSISTYYHSYYLATMAPGIAALVGIGADALWRAWHSSGWRRSWMLIALLSTAGVQAVLLLPYPGWRERLIPLIAGLTVLAAIVFFLVWLMKRTASGWPSAAMLVGVLALLIAPVVWTMIPVATCVNMTLPAAGPQPVDCWTFEIKPFLDPELVNYLYDHREGARFLAATYDSGIAMLGILETGEPFLAVGGYRGSDPILTTEQFVRMVADGEVRFFFSLTQDTESFPQQEGIKQWVQEHCPESPVQSQGVAVRGPCAATE